MWSRVPRVSYLVPVALFVASGCVTLPEFRSVNQGQILTEGVEIMDGEGNAFHWKSGEPFVPAFDQGPDCVLKPDASNPGAGMISGARLVRVKVPQLEEPLYGLLSLCGVPADARGPASRLYNIEVPERFVNATEGGRASVVYEAHTSRYEWGEPKSWILWLSRVPFGNTGTPAPTARSVTGQVSDEGVIAISIIGIMVAVAVPVLVLTLTLD